MFGKDDCIPAAELSAVLPKQRIAELQNAPWIMRRNSCSQRTDGKAIIGTIDDQDYYFRGAGFVRMRNVVQAFAMISALI